MGGYAFVNNSPLLYTDPSGHGAECGPDGDYCGNGQWASPRQPDKVDFSQLTKIGNRSTSGWMMYWLYYEAWKASNGHLTIKQFTIYMLGHEFSPYKFAPEVPPLDEDFIDNLKRSTGNNFWCSVNADTNLCTNLRKNGGASTTAMLNWVASLESASIRYTDVFTNGYNAWITVSKDGYTSLATDVFDFVLYESVADGNLYLNEPFYWGNTSIFPRNPITGTQGREYNQYIKRFDIAYIMTPCQNAYFKRETDYYGIFGIKP